MKWWMVFLLLPPGAFLLGSIPWGILLTRAFSSVDVMKEGSGNIGATNVKRTAGWTLGILTLAGDTAKGAFPVWLAHGLFSAPELWGEAYIAFIAFLAVLGHVFPLYTRFRGGGKGVATAAGSFLALSPAAFFILILIFTMMVCFFNRISLASLSAVLAAPVILWEATFSPVFTAYAAVLAILISMRHRDNVRRLVKGIEPLFF